MVLHGSHESRKRRRRSAAVALEFAFVAPLLILLTLGMVEVTRAAQVKIALCDAVRSGCRIGIEPRSDNDMVSKRVGAVLTSKGIDATKTTVAIRINNVAGDVKNAKEGDRITVSVTISLSDVSWTLPLILPAGAQQLETLSMLRQRSAP